jgi:hypothetical protein
MPFPTVLALESRHKTKNLLQVNPNMKTVYAIAALVLASAFGSAAATKVIPAKTTPELLSNPNDAPASKYEAALPPRAETDSAQAFKSASVDATYPAAAAGATDEAFVDSIIAGALWDRSQVDDLLLHRLRIDLSPCFFQTQSEKEQTQCLRTALEQYRSPDELTNREKRRIVRRARHNYHTD